MYVIFLEFCINTSKQTLTKGKMTSKTETKTKNDLIAFNFLINKETKNALTDKAKHLEMPTASLIRLVLNNYISGNIDTLKIL